MSDKDNDFMRALKCCAIDMDCEHCPNKDEGIGCVTLTLNNSLDLINRMQEDYSRLSKAYVKEQGLFSEQCLENERLKVDIDKLQETIFKKEAIMQLLYSNKQAYYDELVSAKAEIERLKEENENLKINNLKEIRTINENIINQLRLQKSEVRKEFAELVKLEFYREFDELIPSIMADRIDELLEELEKES